MVKEGEAKCPVCDGSGRMSIVEFIGIDKKKVRVPCIACEGRGWIPFVDHTEVTTGIEAEAVTGVGVIEDMSEIGDGWRRIKDWVRAHYFVDGRSLCGNVRSKRSILRSVRMVDVGPEDKCSICKRKLEELGKA